MFDVLAVIASFLAYPLCFFSARVLVDGWVGDTYGLWQFFLAAFVVQVALLWAFYVADGSSTLSPTNETDPSRTKVLFVNLVVPAGETRASVTVNTRGLSRSLGNNRTRMEVAVTGKHSRSSALRVSTAVGEGYEIVRSNGRNMKGHMFLGDTLSEVAVVVEDEMTFEVELDGPSDEDVTVTLGLGSRLMIEANNKRYMLL